MCVCVPGPGVLDENQFILALLFNWPPNGWACEVALTDPPVPPVSVSAAWHVFGLWFRGPYRCHYHSLDMLSTPASALAVGPGVPCGFARSTRAQSGIWHLENVIHNCRAPGANVLMKKKKSCGCFPEENREKQALCACRQLGSMGPLPRGH